MATLGEIIYTIAAKGGKDEDDSFLEMLVPLIHEVRATLIKQHIDRHGTLPWMEQTIRLELCSTSDCNSFGTELISKSKLPRLLRSSSRTFARNVYLPDGTPILITTETDNPLYVHLRPSPIRCFLRNEKVVVAGTVKLKEIRIRDVFENPSDLIGMCCEELDDYPIHVDLIPTLIQMVEQIVYNDVDLPEDMANVQREAGIQSAN